jgi:arylsulfatase/arylsulfatase A
MHPSSLLASRHLVGLAVAVGALFLSAAGRAATAADALAPIEDQPGLPRVLVIGDSISIGYTPPLRALLRGEANVHRPPTNCASTLKGLAELERWLEAGPWDVIHFNWGLHDLKYIGPDGANLADPGDPTSVQLVPMESYRENIARLAERLERTGASLIWRTTTPVPEGAAGRVPGDAARYNAAAAEALAKFDVAIDDHYAFAAPRLADLQLPRNVHFTAAGSRALAEQAAATIRLALAERAQRSAPPRQTAAAPPAGQRPNVIVMITDDQGYGDFGATGNPVFATPALDRLASQSASLAAFYVSPVCSPTRASLMTGRWNYRTRVIDTYLGRSMLEPDELTVAEALQSAGYRTGVFGKWHLGDCYPLRPQDQGFDESLVHRGGGLAQPSEPPANGSRYTDPVLFRNGRETPTVGYCTDVYFNAAWEFIEQSAAEGKPFFTYIATNAPHGPFHDVPLDLLEEYRRRDLGQLLATDASTQASPRDLDVLARIGAMIGNIDQNVKRLMDRLAARGWEENTIVVFLCDNGPNTRRYVGPFRGMKSEVYEGGVRSPCWLRWPARFAPGTTLAYPTAHVDLAPTLLAACGVEDPRRDTRDGRNLLPWLDDPATPWLARPLVLQSHRGDAPTREHHYLVRHGDWKLVRNSGFGREQPAADAPTELYCLADDPGERRDLAAAQPDVVARLKYLYRAWFDDVSHTRPDNFAPPRIVVGGDAPPLTTLTRQDWRGDGWEAAGMGSWLLDVRDPGPYEVRVRWQRPSREGVGALRVNAQALALTQDGEPLTATLHAVTLPEGPVTLSAVADDAGRAAGAHQIELRHVGAHDEGEP